jgi:hypothetical protein
MTKLKNDPAIVVDVGADLFLKGSRINVDLKRYVTRN